jgi:transcriptional regulator with XRE-family HTH domain
MPTSASSSALQARRALADRLRELRLDAGLTAKDLAARARWERTKVSKIEHGVRPPSAENIRIWCRVCGAEDEAADLVASLRAAEGMWVEWRRMERAGLTQAQEARLPLYERTRQFRAYASWVLPGLLQTEDYTRAALRMAQRRRRLVDDVDGAVAARMQRQRVLRRPGKTFAFLVEESVLRAGFGGSEVMTAQLEHLIDVGSLPSVSLGVVPAGPERDSARPVEGFWIFDSEQVNVELVSGFLTISQPREVAMYAQTFADLGEAAVYGPEARELISSVAKKLG